MPIPANNKFAKPGAAGAKPKPAAKPKPKPKKFGSASSNDTAPRDPMFPAGDFRVRHVSAEELTHPLSRRLSWRIQYVCVTDEGEGDTYIALFMDTPAGRSEFVRYCVAAAGYVDAAEFDAFCQAVAPDVDTDEAGDMFFGSVTGEANAFSEAGITLDRRLVDVRVTYGKAVIDKETSQPTGDHYRQFKWTVVPDDEQDEAGKLEAAQ